MCLSVRHSIVLSQHEILGSKAAKLSAYNIGHSVTFSIDLTLVDMS